MIRDWYRKRKRAVKLGDMGHARMWYDPETDEQWQATGRWSLFSVDSSRDSVASTIRMLHHVHMCDLYVDPEEYGLEL